MLYVNHSLADQAWKRNLMYGEPDMVQRYCNALRTVKPLLPVLREVVRSVLILPSLQSYSCPLSGAATLLCNSSFVRYWLADGRTDGYTVRGVLFKRKPPIAAMLHSEQWSHLLCSTQSRVARRRADDINCCTAFRSSVLSSALQTLCIKNAW